MGFTKFSVKDLDKEEALTEEEEAKYTKYFQKFDKDKSGDIDMQELGKVLAHCHFEFEKIPGSLEWMVSLIDLDGSKTLSLGEFKYFVGNLQKWKKQFKKADKDKSGNIDKAELIALLKKNKYQFSDKQVDQLMPLVDKDSSGELSLEEFMLLSIFLRFTKIQFILADTDGSGHLTRKEVGAHLPALGLAVDDATLTKLLGALDTNNDDSLDFEEFASLAAMIKLQ